MLCALGACLLAFAPLSGQKSTYPRALWGGAHVGVSFSRMAFVPSVTQTLHQGYHAGLSLRYDVERGASAQLELNYSQTGWTEAFDDASLAYSRSLTYVELPFLSHLYLQQGNTRIFVNLGPFVGLNIKEQSSSQGTTFSEAQLARQTMPVYTNVNWGLTGGPGVSIALGRRHRIELEGRILYTFSDLWRNQRIDPYGQSSELRFGGSLSYLFRL